MEMMSEWVSDCCGINHDERFHFDDFMSKQPLGVCVKCKEHVTFHKEDDDDWQ